jgi:hypothetical protein
MDSTALILLLLMITFIAIMMYILFYPYTSMRRHHYKPVIPYPVMPQFGPYWTHGGQANSGLLY